MRKVIYKGKPIRLGRYGEVRSGDVLYMYEGEWLDVHGDHDFRLHKDSILPEGPGPIQDFPRKCREHDLRGVPWNSGRLDKVLLRYPRNRLLHIAAALAEDYGMKALSRGDTQDEMADAIHAFIIQLGWHRLSREDILSGGHALK